MEDNPYQPPTINASQEFAPRQLFTAVRCPNCETTGNWWKTQKLSLYPVKCICKKCKAHFKIHSITVLASSFLVVFFIWLFYASFALFVIFPLIAFLSVDLENLHTIPANGLLLAASHLLLRWLINHFGMLEPIPPAS